MEFLSKNLQAFSEGNVKTNYTASSEGVYDY